MPADFVPADRASGPLPGAPVRYRPRRVVDLLGWLVRPVLWPGTAAMRGIAAAAVTANAVIMMTGAAVQLSKSGLGCPDWPKCTAASLAATRVPGQTTLNTWMEFGNRLITFPVVIVGVLALVAAWQFRAPGAGRTRKDLVWLAAALPAGAVGQAVIGGIVIYTKLNPAWVAVHFVFSTAIVGAAVALHVRCRESTAPARSLVRADLRVLAGALVAATAVMIAAGTVVNGAGPLVGNAAAPRFHLSFVGATQFHADIGWLMAGLSVALVLGLTLGGAPRPAVRWSWTVLALIAAQGAIGYAQYFDGMPAGLVWVHICVAVLVWIAVLRLLFALRDRGSVTEPDREPARPVPQGRH